MKTTRNLAICLTVILLSVPMMYAEDLSKYRNFSLGATLADVSKQINQRPGNTQTIQQTPAVIQQVEWWPVPLNLLKGSESIQKVIFSFYNLKLYKIAATYDSEATAGLTAADMIGAVSASYGAATRVAAETNSHSAGAYGAIEPPLAQWDDAQYSVTLSRDSLLNTFHLVLLTKQLNAQAETSVVEAAKQERADAPQKEMDRVKKAADDLETERQANLKIFRP